MSPPDRINSVFFNVDHSDIRRQLANANALLTNRCDELLSAVDRAPDPIETLEDLQKALQFARQLGNAGEQIRQVRLSDGRPFSDGTKTVKIFFDEWERPLRGAKKKISQLTAEATTRLSSNQINSPFPTDAGTISKPIHSDRSQSIDNGDSQRPNYELRLAWAVESFDRNKINLESLRPYLSDEVILTACKKHLRVNGPNKIQGVTYKEVAQL
jgi:hypothetical protein